MKVAIVHEWLVNFRGSERVLLELARMYPEAVLYASVLDRKKLPEELASRDIRTTFVNRLPFSTKLYPLYLPFMPRAYEQLDLSAYDLVISSSHSCAKGIIPSPSATHICYCYTPMRYAWNGFHEYQKTLRTPLTRWLMARLMHRMRIWDYATTARVDYFVACSHEIRRRIAKYYRRDSDVIHPPVEVRTKVGRSISNAVESLIQSLGSASFFLCLGRLVHYKRVDIAVEVCTTLGLPLIVAGGGPEYGILRRLAGPTVHFVQEFTDDDAGLLYEHCQALLFPGYEDFGITMVEAQLNGKPIIAFGAGGALDIVVPGETGILFQEQDASGLTDALRIFESREFVCETIKANGMRFSPKYFQASIRALITSYTDKENA